MPNVDTIARTVGTVIGKSIFYVPQLVATAYTAYFAISGAIALKNAVRDSFKSMDDFDENESNAPAKEAIVISIEKM